MKKQNFINMGYKKLNEGEIETYYKKFENGNVHIAQFNKDEQQDEVGMVYLTQEQLKIFSK